MGKWKTGCVDGRTYKEEWEKDHKWLINKGGACYCKLCNCTISTMKKSNLVLHETTQKHKKASQSVVKSNNKIMKTFVKSPKGRQSEVKIFEIRYAVGIACHSSIRSVDHYTEIISDATKGHALEDVKMH